MCHRVVYFSDKKRKKLWKTAQVGHTMVAFVRPLRRLHRFLHVFGGKNGKHAGKKSDKDKNGSKDKSRNSICLCSLALLFFSLVFAFASVMEPTF